MLPIITNKFDLTYMNKCLIIAKNKLKIFYEKCSSQTSLQIFIF